MGSIFLFFLENLVKWIKAALGHLMQFKVWNFTLSSFEMRELLKWEASIFNYRTNVQLLNIWIKSWPVQMLNTVNSCVMKKLKKLICSMNELTQVYHIQ